MDNLIGMKIKVVSNLEDHENYKGQELEITESLGDDYYIATDGVSEWQVGLEETDVFDKLCNLSE